MKSATLMLAAVALVLVGVGQTRADLIVNGGFETGDFTGWTTGANSYPETIKTSPVHSGTYAAQIAGYSSNPNTLSQTVTTTSGQAYTLSFARYQVYQGPPVFLTVDWDGAAVFTDPAPTVGGVYQVFSVNVVGTGSDTLTFISANDPAYTYVDDVSFNASLIAAPEPSTLTLFGIGAVGLVGLARRQRKSAAA
jgi:hypothetical protein